ncbi:MAG: hypothetical protein QXV30_06380 [Desulfurococcaceae archaeon]
MVQSLRREKLFEKCITITCFISSVNSEYAIKYLERFTWTQRSASTQ